MGSSAPSEPGRHDRQERRLAGAGVLEVVRKIGVEGDAVAGVELVAIGIDDQAYGAGLDERGLAAAGLVHGWVAGAAGLRTGRQDVARDLGAEPRRGRRQDLVAMTASATLAPFRGAHDGDRAVLVQAQQL